MSRGKHAEAEMIVALKQMEAGRKTEDVAREMGVSKHTIYAPKTKYGGMEVSEPENRHVTHERGKFQIFWQSQDATRATDECAILNRRLESQQRIRNRS